MGNGEDRGFVLDAARGHHLAMVNAVLRRPGMYSTDEIAEQLLLEAMAAVDDKVQRLQAEWTRLRQHGALNPDARTAYAAILPAESLRDATASVYAEVAHRMGWLELNRAMPSAEFGELAVEVERWVEEDRTLPDLVDRFGPPSLWIGGSNPLYPKTTVYSTGRRRDGLTCFHLWNAVATITPDTGPVGVYPDPVVLAVRHRPGPSTDAFSFTPAGLRHRPRGDHVTPLPTVWIFHGDRASHAAAVFTTLGAGLAWAAGHHVTGILAEYPYGGAFDAAVREGRFAPSEAHHGIPDHVAAFGPGLRQIHLTGGRQD